MVPAAQALSEPQQRDGYEPNRYERIAHYAEAPGNRRPHHYDEAGQERSGVHGARGRERGNHSPDFARVRACEPRIAEVPEDCAYYHN